MTFNSFLSLLIEKGIDYDSTYGQVEHWCWKTHKDVIEQKGRPCLVNQWLIGGANGGNYKGGRAREFSSDVEEPPFTDLETILDSFPNLTYTQYKEIMRLIETDIETEGGYYGNYEVYKARVLDLKNFYKWLVENNFLEI